MDKATKPIELLRANFAWTPRPIVGLTKVIIDNHLVGAANQLIDIIDQGFDLIHKFVEIRFPNRNFNEVAQELGDINNLWEIIFKRVFESEIEHIRSYVEEYIRKHQ